MARSKTVVVHVSPFRRTNGGITTVVENYLSSSLAETYSLVQVETHCDGARVRKLWIAVIAFLKCLWLAVIVRPNIIHVHVGNYPSIFRKSVVCLPLLIFGAKRILHFHGSTFIEQYQRRTKMVRRLTDHILQSFDLVICLSESWRKDLYDVCGVRHSVVIPNAVPVVNCGVEERECNSIPRVLFLGEIGERKGVFELIDVVGELIAQGTKLKLDIGGNGDIKRLRQTIQKRALNDVVTFLGWVTHERKSQALFNADIFSLPSHAEGMPMAILEAMAYGLPILSTRVGGIPEVVEDQVNGFLLVPGERKALREAIERLLCDVALRRKMGARSREIIQRKFSLEGHIDLIECAYDHLLKSATVDTLQGKMRFRSTPGKTR